MILVQNRRLPLSGSRSLVLLTYFFLLSSCSLLQGTASAKSDEPATTDDKKKVEEKREDTKKKEEKKTTNTVTFHGEKFEVKPFDNKFNVALILPFNLAKREEDALGKIMLDYYEGVLLATDRLKEQGINLTLFVYDNLNDTNELKRILKKEEMKTMSLIVGPVYKQHLEIVSEFSIANNIPVLNPLSPHSMLAVPNPYYFNNELEYSKVSGMLATYMHTNYPDADIIVVKDGKKLQQQMLPAFADTIKKLYGVVPKYVNAHRGMSFVDNVNKKKKTIIFIPSLETLTVSESLNGLSGIDSNVIVFGFKEWLDLKNNDYKIWERCEMHLIASGFVDYHDTAVMNFRQQYREKFMGEPTDYVFKGYDDFLFFGEALLAFGPDFIRFIPNREFRYLYNTYKFVLGDKCFENHGIAILRFKDYKLQRD